MRFPTLGVRTRILAIALVPSLALVVIGVSAAGALVDRSRRAHSWADEMQAGIAPTRELIEAVQSERQLTLWRMAGVDTDVRRLTTARQRLDKALRVLAPTQASLSEMGPESMSQATDAVGEVAKRLAGLRSGVDAGTAALPDVYAFYNRIPQSVMAGVEIAEKTAPDAATTVELTQAADVLHSLEAMSRAYALGAALLEGNALSPELGAEYLSLVGYYRTRFDGIVSASDEKQSNAAQVLVSGPAWQRLGVVEPVLAQRTLNPSDGSTKRAAALPISIADWQRSADEVAHGLADLWQAENTDAQELASSAASDTTRKSLWAGAGMVWSAWSRSWSRWRWPTGSSAGSGACGTAPSTWPTCSSRRPCGGCPPANCSTPRSINPARTSAGTKSARWQRLSNTPMRPPSGPRSPRPAPARA
ncbi:nitrate- and nitrite sensing domain-containing protein [Nocardia seriolae]|uniref:Histidine kinase n=1 Tax=Nocardia seriolae TaxID=37332 RepID=A0A0B8NPE0_9NOCA|nr:nitrate- and nitrite sensing domain-containing protein [Nocardia seriolae]APA98648.1 hypothetical protein NS506_04600 [Nocardia seriolae]MTJ63725.1 hypothetical protein [Nocardia seriolae]MTJ75552.1 hypothetical protein [Nocardia seriolae]MTJ88292.1 hypothetical protein [Nocardia seriolae]MTK32278.1 hypothetical protein [Nocardia seriolae]